MEQYDSMDDDMRPEYDLKSMTVRSMGPERTQFGNVIRLDADVAEVLKTAKSVNTILRALIAAMPKVAL